MLLEMTGLEKVLGEDTHMTSCSVEFDYEDNDSLDQMAEMDEAVDMYEKGLEIF